jgi:hypothetical protein
MFTLGNFITLGIVVLLLIFYRQLDKRNRTLDKVRKYADHLKSELTAFVTEKENAVKDYSVSLDVEQKSAKELMKRVQITDAELAEKAKAIAKIDERITAYDSSLEELVHMTARVQENMNRLREESTFIESVNKKITDAQSKLHAVEQQTADIKMDFTKENSAYLEKLAGDILANVKSSVTELKIQSQAVERHVGEQCVAMEKAEHIRAANLQRDMDILNRTLKTVMERAANKADSLEVETLENLKAESEKRIQDLKSSIEETFRDSHVKAQEQLNKVRSIAEENQSMWEADRIEFEAKEQSRREKLNSDANALLSTLAEKSEEMKKASSEDDAKFKKFLADMEAASANVRSYIVSQNDALEQKFKETKQRIDETVNLLEIRVKNVSNEAEQRALEKADERLGNWQQLIHESDANLQKTLSSLESSSIDIQDHFAKKTAVLKQRLDEVERQIETEATDLRDRIDKISEESQAHVADEAQTNLEQILRTYEEQNGRLVRNVQELETKAESIKNYFDSESTAMSRKILDAELHTEEAAAGLDNRLQRTAMEVERKVVESTDVRLEDWKKAAADAEANLKNLLVNLETSAVAIRTDFDTEKALIAQKLMDVSLQTEKTIDGLKENIARASESVEAKIADEADAKLQQWLAASQDRNDKAKLILEGLERTTAQAKSAFDAEVASMDKRLDEAKTRSDQMIDSWSASMELRLGEADKKLADTETYVEHAILDSEKRIATAIANAELSALEKADAELVEWRKRFEEQMMNRDKVSEEESMQNRRRFEDLARSFDETKERLAREIEETKDRLTGVQGEMDAAIEKIEDAIGQAVEATDEKAESAAKNRLLQWREASKQAEAEAESRNSAFLALFNQNYEQASAEIEKLRFDLIDKFNQSYEKASAEALERMENFAEQFKKAAAEHEKQSEDLVAQWERVFADTSTQNTEELSNIEANFSKTKQCIADEITGAELRLHSIQEKMDETVHRIEYVIKDTIANTDAKAAQVADDRLAQWKQASEQAAASSEERTQALIAQWERIFADTSVKNAAELSVIEANFTESKQRISDEIADIASRLREVKESVDNAVEGIDVDVKGVVDGAERRLQAIQAEMDETASRIESAIKDAIVDVDVKAAQVADDRLAQWEQASGQAIASAEERTQALIAQWERIFADTSAKNAAELSVIEANFTESKQRISDEIAGIESRLREVKESVDNTVEGIDVDVKGVVDGAEKRLQTVQAEMDETASRIESAIKDAIVDVDAKAAQVADDRLVQWKQTSEQTIASAEEQANTFIAQWKQMYEQSITVAEERASNSIERFKKDAGENMEMNKTLLDQWKTAVETLTVQDRAQLGALRDSWNQTKNQWSGEIIDAENRLKFLESQIKESAAHIGTVMKEAVEKAESTAHNQADKRIEEWRNTVQQTDEQARRILADFETSLSSAKQSLVSEEEAMGERFKSMRMEAREAVDKLERQLQLSVEDMEQQILNSTDAKFEEYQKVQSEQFQRFEALSDDAAMLDEELRRYLSDVQERIKRDFSAFEQASGKEQAMALADFTETSNSLKVEMGNIEKEIATLKETAYNNVSEKLDIFENDFSSNLAKRSDEIDKRLNEWRRYLDNQLNALTEEGESKWKIIEASYAEQFSEKLTESYDNWLAELEKLKTEAEDFEENIRVQMKIADDSFISLKEQFTQDMENARGSAEASLKAEIGRHNLALSDTLKQSQRDIGAKLKHLQEEVETRNSELISLYETSRHSIDEWKAGFNNQLRDMETALEETRKRSKDLVAESNERLSGVRTSLEDVRTEADAHRAELFSRIDEQARSMDAAIKEAERHIKDFVHQTSLFERADTLKVELEHYIEDLHGDLDKIDQHKTESANLENQFIRIKRLEDEVNAKMTRFLSEKHRIEQMETEFNRLLQTSKAVDEKLSQLSESDDTLQAMQIQIRKFNDALDASEEKFKRIERKNQTLDATNEGIDRNFKALQESEQTVQRIGGELTYLSNEMGVLRTNIGYMAKESEKAKSVADKVASLDTTLFEIDQRISTAQASREWLARLETRLEELNKQAQDQVKLIGTLMKDNGAPLKSAKGAPPIGTRENVIKLSQQGWTVDEIARAQKLGRGEVELILELAHNG